MFAMTVIYAGRRSIIRGERRLRTHFRFRKEEGNGQGISVEGAGRRGGRVRAGEVQEGGRGCPGTGAGSRGRDKRGARGGHGCHRRQLRQPHNVPAPGPGGRPRHVRGPGRSDTRDTEGRAVREQDGHHRGGAGRRPRHREEHSQDHAHRRRADRQRPGQGRAPGHHSRHGEGRRRGRGVHIHADDPDHGQHGHGGEADRRERLPGPVRDHHRGAAHDGRLRRGDRR